MAERVIRIDEAPGSKPGFSIFFALTNPNRSCSLGFCHFFLVFLKGGVCSTVARRVKMRRRVLLVLPSQSRSLAVFFVWAPSHAQRAARPVRHQ